MAPEVRIVRVLLAYVVVREAFLRIDELVLAVDVLAEEDGIARLYHDGPVDAIVEKVRELTVVLKFSPLLYSGASLRLVGSLQTSGKT